MGSASRILALLACVASGCLPDTSDFTFADLGRSDGAVDGGLADGGLDMFVPQSCTDEGDCRSPRNECQLEQGECTGGECVYETRTGEVCDDGDLCTEGDRCEAVGCVGTRVVCTPPEPRCTGDTLVTSTGGRCEGGDCVFDESAETCPMGCAAGACEVEVCVPMDWTLTDIDAAAAVDFSADADHRADSAGNDHLVYISTDGLHYVTRPRGGTWSDELVESAGAGTLPDDPSLGFDASDVPHIVFTRWNEEVVHAFPSGGGWDTDAVASRGATPAIAGTPDGAIHVVYENSGLRHATLASGASEWVTEPIRRSDGGFTRAANGDGIVLLADDGGVLHLVFTDFGEDDLSYGRFTSEWTLETVHGALVLPSAFDATLGSGGDVHVSFSDDAGGDLHYGRRASGAGSWAVVRIHDDLNPVGDPNAIAVTGSGDVHIVYRDEDRRDVRYAWCPAGGSCDHAALEPDNGFAAGAYADDAGRVRLVYRAVPPAGSDELRVAELRECP